MSLLKLRRRRAWSPSESSVASLSTTGCSDTDLRLLSVTQFGGDRCPTCTRHDADCSCSCILCACESLLGDGAEGGGGGADTCSDASSLVHASGGGSGTTGAARRLRRSASEQDTAPLLLLHHSPDSVSLPRTLPRYLKHCFTLCK
ncbi:unnamed protein product [Notodromas monacha]|uniref:Uncharacterized protein n=1 Tax=Notodromas monacha TaxID=399045 RepID=A0A7R9BJC3_9CRUS|nr:unnamed protein product [Notodromas monacha]CAG0916538.1 unnamed protein product [Notodromas monacha]